MHFFLKKNLKVKVFDLFDLQMSASKIAEKTSKPVANREAFWLPQIAHSVTIAIKNVVFDFCEPATWGMPPLCNNNAQTNNGFGSSVKFFSVGKRNWASGDWREDSVQRAERENFGGRA